MEGEIVALIAGEWCRAHALQFNVAGGRRPEAERHRRNAVGRRDQEELGTMPHDGDHGGGTTGTALVDSQARDHGGGLVVGPPLVTLGRAQRRRDGERAQQRKGAKPTVERSATPSTPTIAGAVGMVGAVRRPLESNAPPRRAAAPAWQGGRRAPTRRYASDEQHGHVGLIGAATGAPSSTDRPSARHRALPCLGA